MKTTKLKIGDNLLCIKDHYDLVKKDNFYKILNIEIISYDLIIITSIEKGVVSSNQTYWSTSKCGDHYQFSDFFISIHEERRKKLKKIKKLNSL